MSPVTSSFLLVAICYVGLSVCATIPTGGVTGDHETVPTSDICKDFPCPDDKICRPIEEKPTCICNKICPTTFVPICGSDNKTYSNDCVLKVEACLNCTNITKAHDGSCSHTTGCDTFMCPYGSMCHEDLNGPVCHCTSNCPEEYYFVCGSDGKTYINDCVLARQACETSTNITIANYGKCEKGSVTGDHEKPTGGPEFMVGGVTGEHNETTTLYPHTTESCNETTGSVTGDHEKSIGPEFMVDVTGEYNETTTPYPDTTHTCNVPTDVCFNHFCPDGKICKPTGKNETKCECNHICPMDEAPVCGNDGITYSNECVMKVSSCYNGTNITKSHDGPCTPDCDCATYKCPFASTCQMDQKNQTKCECDTGCPKNYQPVCGSDGKTHSNLCYLAKTACDNKEPITLVCYGECPLA